MKISKILLPIFACGTLIFGILSYITTGHENGESSYKRSSYNYNENEIDVIPTSTKTWTYNLMYQKPPANGYFSFQKTHCYGTYANKDACEATIRSLERRDGSNLWNKWCQSGTSEDCVKANR